MPPPSSKAPLTIRRDSQASLLIPESASVLTRIRPYAPIALLAFLIFYFGFQALTGDRGLLTWADRDEILAARTQELRRLRVERADLEARARAGW